MSMRKLQEWPVEPGVRASLSPWLGEVQGVLHLVGPSAQSSGLIVENFVEALSLESEYVLLSLAQILKVSEW